MFRKMLKTGMLIQLNQWILPSVLVQQFLFQCTNAIHNSELWAISKQHFKFSILRLQSRQSKCAFTFTHSSVVCTTCRQFQISMESQLWKVMFQIPTILTNKNSHWKAILLELNNYAKTFQMNNQICNWKLCWKKWSAVVRCALMKNVSSSAKYKSDHDFLF